MMRELAHDDDYSLYYYVAAVPAVPSLFSAQEARSDHSV